MSKLDRVRQGWTHRAALTAWETAVRTDPLAHSKIARGPTGTMMIQGVARSRRSNNRNLTPKRRRGRRRCSQSPVWDNPVRLEAPSLAGGAQHKFSRRSAENRAWKTSEVGRVCHAERRHYPPPMRVMTMHDGQRDLLRVEALCRRCRRRNDHELTTLSRREEQRRRW